MGWPFLFEFGISRKRNGLGNPVNSPYISTNTTRLDGHLCMSVYRGWYSMSTALFAMD